MRLFSGSFIRVIFCWRFLVLLAWILADSPKIHASKHKRRQNLAGVTPENTVTQTIDPPSREDYQRHGI
jgi:hypothetical protein